MGRNIPLTAARKLGKVTRVFRLLPVFYILTVFFALPLIFLGISELFENASPAYETLGAFIVIIIGLAIIYFIYWMRLKDGANKTVVYFTARNKRADAMKTLPEDMEELKSEIARLKSHTGLPEEAA